MLSVLYPFIGSRCDGFQSKDSDIDIMHVLYKVYLEDAPYVKHNRNAHLIAVTSPRSSYVQIQLNKILPSVNIRLSNSVIYYDRRMLICSSLFVKNYKLIGTRDIVGPSSVSTSPSGKSVDNVHALKCNYWPKIADEWIQRQRKYSWPTAKLVTFIKSKGCHYVPIGDYNSKFNDLEWRVSFVLSECALVRSFNHVQFKVYCLLKLLKMHLHQVSFESLITSYHVKTIIFFAIENSPTSVWSNNNIIICFRMCLVHLQHFVISKYLPHYFLPQCNLFKKLSGADHEHSSIVLKLNKYISNVTILINQLLNNYLPDGNIINGLTILGCYSNQCAYPTVSKLLIIHSMLDNFNSYSDFELTMITKITLDIIYCNIDVNGRGILKDNKIMYKTEIKPKYICLRRSHYDVAAGWLQLSTFYYVTQQYNKTEQICKKVLVSLSSEVLCTGNCGDRSTLVNTLLDCHMSVQQRVKQLTATYVHIYVNGLYPNELDIEVANYLYSTTVLLIPTQPYAYFVLFLCAYHRHDATTQHDIVCILESFIHCEHCEHCGLRPRDTETFIILNMLGICYELSGDKQRAAFYYMKSINMKTKYKFPNPHEEAANIRLQLLAMQRQ